jgi:ribonuclease VapC
MVVDTSAILAILSNDPEREHFTQMIILSPPAMMSAATYLEARIVTEARWGRAGLQDFKLLLAATPMGVIPFDGEQAVLAAEAYSRYGRGRHEASLNFGDCFAYALAKKTGQSLLFKGDDFSRTDVLSATHR